MYLGWKKKEGAEAGRTGRIKREDGVNPPEAAGL